MGVYGFATYVLHRISSYGSTTKPTYITSRHYYVYRMYEPMSIYIHVYRCNIYTTQTYRCNIWDTYYRYGCSLFDMAADTKARRSRKTVWQKVTTYRYIWYIQYVYTSPLLREDFSKIEFPHPAYFRSKPYSPLARILRWRQYARRHQEEVEIGAHFFPRSFRISRYVVYFFLLPGSSTLD